MKNLFLITLLAGSTWMTAPRAADDISDVLNGDEITANEESYEADEDAAAANFELDRPWRPGRPGPGRPRPGRPGRYTFLGCFEHRRYCERTASLHGMDAYAQLDGRCSFRRPWSCYATRRGWAE